MIIFLCKVLLFSKKDTFSAVLSDVSANVCAIEYNLLRNQSFGKLACKMLGMATGYLLKRKSFTLGETEVKKLPFLFSVL